jgi:PPM family protein phosphatase
MNAEDLVSPEEESIAVTHPTYANSGDDDATLPPVVHLPEAEPIPQDGLAALAEDDELEITVIEFAELAEEEGEAEEAEADEAFDDEEYEKGRTVEEVVAWPKAEPFIEIAKRCNVGMVRQRNEDGMFSFVALSGGLDAAPPFALALVADGMGGHHGGDKASRLVSRTLGKQVLSQIYLPLLQDESPPPMSEVMLEAVELANHALYTSDPEKEGGTTLTAVLLFGQRMFLVHVGDSRAYLYHETESTLYQLTTDHTVVRRLQEAGHITAAEAETHPHRNMLYRAINGHELEVDTYTRSLPTRGKLLLCSDGLWGAIDPEHLGAILADGSLTAQEQVDLLIETALLGGSTDNITAVVVNFGY